MSKECALLHQMVRGLPRMKVGFNAASIPENGIYFLFEEGEFAHGGGRIVRIGTHTGRGNLPKRIFEHLYTPNKDRSIFRKHIGRCLLRRDDNPFMKFWEIDLTKKADRERFAHQIDVSEQNLVEMAVTDYMSTAFSFSIIHVEEKRDRLDLEGRLISTICQCDECHASPKWLGKWHANTHISMSGLWNIQGQKEKSLTVQEISSLSEQIMGD